VVSPARSSSVLALAGRALLRAHRDAIGGRASALAYATLVSIVPLLAMVSIFVAETLRQDEGRTLRLIAQLLPYREESVLVALKSFVDQAESVSSLALVGFLVTSLGTFFLVQETLFEIFRVSAPPSPARRVIAFSALVFFGPVLIGSVYGGLLYLGQTRPGLGRLLRESTLLYVLPALATLLGLALLYWRAAAGRIRFRHALAGSLAATLLLELLKAGFVVYVASFTPVQRAIYGSLAIALFFLLSVQLAWWMMLYGAEVAACLGIPPSELEAERGHVPDAWTGLAALEQLARPGRPSLPAARLAAELGMPADALAAHLAPLAERGLLEAPLAPGGTWRLAVAPGRVRLAAVFAAYEPERRDDAVAGAASDDGAGPGELERLRARLAGARAEALAGATLDEWLSGGRKAESGPDPDPEEAPPRA
jgi:membrane protein